MRRCPFACSSNVGVEVPHTQRDESCYDVSTVRPEGNKKDARCAHRGYNEEVATVSVRYIVNDVDEAVAFYRDELGFTEVMHPAPAFAMLAKSDMRLVLSAPGGGPGGGQAMPDGTLP